MATPIDMRHMGPMTSMIQEGRVEPEDMLDATGNVPADVMRNSFRVLDAARRRHRLRQPVAAPLERRLRRRPPGDDPVVERPHPVPRRRLLPDGRADVAPEPAGDRAASRSAGAPSTSPTSRCRSSTSSARRTTSCRPRPSARCRRSSGRATSTELRLPAGHVGLIVGRTAQRDAHPGDGRLDRRPRASRCDGRAGGPRSRSGRSTATTSTALRQFFARVPEGDRTFFREDVLAARRHRALARRPRPAPPRRRRRR